MSKSVSASIVLYKHYQNQLTPLINELVTDECVKKIYLIDNGGSEWAESFISEKIYYLGGHGNIGYGAGHNLALFHQMNDCDFHLVCNPDIRIPEGTLKGMLEFTAERTAGLYMPRILYPDGREQELCKLLPSPADLFGRRFLPWLANKRDHRYLLRARDYEKLLFVPYLSGCFMFLSTTSARRQGGFDERFFMYLEDTDLSRRIAWQDGALYIPRYHVYHEYQKGSYHSLRLLMLHIRSTIQYFNKWGWVVDKQREELNARCLGQLKKNEIQNFSAYK